MNLRKLTITLAVAFAAGNAGAGTLYAIDDDARTLISIDTTTLSVTTIGAIGVASGTSGDLAYDDAAGTMYWVAGSGNNNLYTIDLSTGAATLIGSHGVGGLFALGWNGSTLFGQSVGAGVYTIDTATAAATLIGSNGVRAGGYDYNPITGKLVLLESGLPGASFYSINQSNGAATLLGGFASIDQNDVAFDADTNSYWAIDYQGDLYNYDASTYAQTIVLTGLGRSASLEYISGQAVPEPATLALLGVGLAGLGFSRRKQ